MKKVINVIFFACVGIFLAGCVSWHSGIAPLYPPGEKIIPAPKVDSLTPTLKWEPIRLDKASNKITNIRYDIVIYTTTGFPPKNIVAYKKDEISETSHMVATQLKPSTQYFWRIRAKYKQNGNEVTGKWNGFGFVALNTYATNKPYFFKTP